MEYYKIRHKPTGLYSSGGTTPTFRKVGKVWTLGQLRSHLRMIQKGTKNFIVYLECEVVSFTETTGPVKITLSDLLDPLEQELVVNKLKG